MTDPGELAILPLTDDRLPDLALLFGQGGDPKRCWCAWFRVRARDWQSDAMANRELLEEAVRRGAAEGRAPGLVAYRDGEPVGWVSLGPRDDYPRLEHSTVLGRIDEAPVWSIVCFVVGRRERRRGVARALLDAAAAYAAEHGATLLEAYPVDTRGEKIASASIYRGTLSMFERAGFEVVDRRQAPGAKRQQPIVRRPLA